MLFADRRCHNNAMFDNAFLHPHKIQDRVVRHSKSLYKGLFLILDNRFPGVLKR
jgi:hypothetical protein